MNGFTLKGRQILLIRSFPVTIPNVFYGYVIVAAALAISIVMWGARLSFGVFFAPVLDEFGWTRAVISGGFSLTWAFTGILSIAVGMLTDRFGPRLIMTMAGILTGLGYLLMSQLHSVWQLVAFYGVISIGMSAISVPTLSAVARWFFKLRAFMTGIVMAGIGFALMSIVPTTNQMILNYSWRTAYLMLGAVVMIVVVAAAQFLRGDPYEMGCLPYGSKEGSGTGRIGRTSHGLLFKEALRTYQIWLINIIYFSAYFIYNVLLVHIIIHAKGQGIASVDAVGIIVSMGAAGIAGRILTGLFADKVGSKQAMVLSTGLMALPLFWLATANELRTLLLLGAVFGFGHGGISTMQSPIVANVFGLRSHGITLGLVFCWSSLGGAIGPFLAGYIFDVTRSYDPAFVLCAILGLISMGSALFLRPLKLSVERKFQDRQA